MKFVNEIFLREGGRRDSKIFLTKKLFLALKSKNLEENTIFPSFFPFFFFFEGAGWEREFLFPLEPPLYLILKSNTKILKISMQHA